MPVEYTGFLLSPFGFFDRNPALDVPPSSAPGTGHCRRKRSAAGGGPVPGFAGQVVEAEAGGVGRRATGSSGLPRDEQLLKSIARPISCWLVPGRAVGGLHDDDDIW